MMEFTSGGSFLNSFIFLVFISLLCGNKHVGTMELPESRHRWDTFPVHSLDENTAVRNNHNPNSKIVKRSTANVVDISLFDDNSAPGKQFSFYVDNTMTRLIIQVKVDRSNPVMMVTKPSGMPGPRPALNTTSATGTNTATVDTAITAGDYGIWKIMKMDASTWNVKIQGESPLDFTYQFLAGTFIQIPVTGDPIQGETYKIVITVPEYTKIQKIDMIMLFITEKSTPANMMFPSDKGGGKYDTSMTMVDKEFMIGIQGKDTNGNFFRRISSVIKPVTLSLSVPSYAGVKLYENAKLDIAFSVVNKLSTDQDIDVRIKDTQRLAEDPVFISATLKPGENFTGKFVIKGTLAGITTVVTITARQYLGFGKGFSLGPSEVRQFTVEKNVTTTTSTTTTTTTTASTTTTSTTTSTTTPTTTTSSTTASTTTPTTTTSSTTTSTTTPTKTKSSTTAPSSAPITTVSKTTTKSTPASSLPVSTPLARSPSVSSSPTTKQVTASNTHLPASTAGATSLHSSSSQSVPTATAKSSTHGSSISATGITLINQSSSSQSATTTTLKQSTSGSSISAKGSHASSSKSSSNNPPPVTSSATVSVAKSSYKVSSLSTLPATTTSGKVAVTTGSVTGKTSPSSSGKISVIPSASTVKPGPLVATTHLSATSLPPVTNALNSGKATTTAAEQSDEGGDAGGETFSKGEVFAVAIASGIATGVIIGIAALVTMGLVLKSGLKGKNSVSPEKKNQRTLSEHNDLAWT